MNASCFFVIIFITFLLMEVYGAWVNQEESTESPLQLIGKGKLSKVASYGHLHFPIKILQIEKSFDDWEDVIEAYEHYALQGGAAKALRYSINRLRVNISLMGGFFRLGQLHLAL